jgi:hypothetical protein
MHATATLPAASIPWSESGIRALRDSFARPLDLGTSALALTIVLLNLVDGFATLRHLTYGAEELNPLMQILLQHSAAAFLLVKHLLASLGVIGIAMHGRVRAARVALWLLFPLYVAIAVYQMLLFAVIR